LDKKKRLKIKILEKINHCPDLSTILCLLDSKALDDMFGMLCFFVFFMFFCYLYFTLAFFFVISYILVPDFFLKKNIFLLLHDIFF
jgi:hypothetical protein